MRIIPLFLFLFVGLVCCKPHHPETTGSILFTTTPVQSTSLLVKPILKCYPGKQHLELDLRMESLTPEKITITEIVLSSTKGLRSLDEDIAGKTFTIPAKGDTTFLLTFNPVNDNALFQTTGMPGLIDSVYTLDVFYSVEGKQDVRVVKLMSRMPEEVFLAYRKFYSIPVQIYHCNTENAFGEKQRQFLMTSGIIHKDPFVHVTEQEVAVSGLNFRIKCFHRKDSLHTEIFAVNHSDMTIRIDTSAMELTVDDLKQESSPATVHIEKVTGSKSDAVILRKGDRSIIRMQKYIRSTPEKVRLSLAETFFLSDGKALFNDDLELKRAK